MDDGVKTFTCTDTLDYPIINPDYVGGLSSHYGGASMQRRGRQEARAILYALTGSGTYGAARIASAQFADETLTVVRVALSHRGGTDFTPTSAIPGFTVTDAGGTKTISLAVRFDATHVDLTLSSACVGTTSVLYLTGKNPAGPSGLLTDNQADPVAIASLTESITVSAYVPPPPPPPPPAPTWTLRDQMGADLVDVFLNVSEFAETASYYPRNGASMFVVLVVPEDTPEVFGLAAQTLVHRRSIKFTASTTVVQDGIATVEGLSRLPLAGDVLSFESGAYAGVWTVIAAAADSGGAVQIEAASERAGVMKGRR
jgi:hypothetical protein